MTRPVEALVSVRSVEEALTVADAGVRLIDCKEPRDGALGALAIEDVRAIVAALRGRSVEISATCGDRPGDLAAIAAQLAAAGVDRVKVGVGSMAWLQRLARLPARIVPVLIADDGLDDAVVEAACEAFDTVMLDTADKSAGSLFDRVPLARLRSVVGRARRAGRRIGIAGALRVSELPLVHQLRPDFAGFRSAVCEPGQRGGALNAQQLRQLLDALDLATA